VEIDRRSHQVSGVFSGSPQNPKHKIEITKKMDYVVRKCCCLAFFWLCRFKPIYKTRTEKESKEHVEILGSCPCVATGEINYLYMQKKSRIPAHDMKLPLGILSDTTYRMKKKYDSCAITRVISTYII
jgi:hypothetical protein